MDFRVPSSELPYVGALRVPPSKSVMQRALVLAALAEGETTLVTEGLQPPGEDVRRLAAAVERLGRWSEGALGPERRSLRLDLGLGATGFRFCMALATLRRAGARTLVGGRPALLRRPHGPLLQALTALGARMKRRHSGAMRVHGGGIRPGRVVLDAGTSSQFASALMLVAPRIGGIEIRLRGRPVSLPYLALTREVLSAFGLGSEAALEGPAGGTISVPGGVPRGTRIALEADASAASAWWAAAALTGGSIEVPGLARASRQADLALLPLLERMGAEVYEGVDGAVGVRGPGGALRPLGEVDLSGSSDLLPLVGALASVAAGSTRIVGVRHARAKESDRVATVARGIARLGGHARVTAAGDLAIEGARLRAGLVPVAGDHRIAFAFALLGLAVPGVRLQGAQAVVKSHPRFLEDLARVARGTQAVQS